MNHVLTWFIIMQPSMGVSATGMVGATLNVKFFLALLTGALLALFLIKFFSMEGFLGIALCAMLYGWCTVLPMVLL